MRPRTHKSPFDILGIFYNKRINFCQQFISIQLNLILFSIPIHILIHKNTYTESDITKVYQQYDNRYKPKPFYFIFFHHIISNL